MLTIASTVQTVTSGRRYLWRLGWWGLTVWRIWPSVARMELEIIIDPLELARIEAISAPREAAAMRRFLAESDRRYARAAARQAAYDDSHDMNGGQ